MKNVNRCLFLFIIALSLSSFAQTVEVRGTSLGLSAKFSAASGQTAISLLSGAKMCFNGTNDCLSDSGGQVFFDSGLFTTSALPTSGVVFGGAGKFTTATLGTTSGQNFVLGGFTTLTGPNVIGLNFRAKNTGSGGGASNVSLCASYDVDAVTGNSICIGSSNAVTLAAGLTVNETLATSGTVFPTGSQVTFISPGLGTTSGQSWPLFGASTSSGGNTLGLNFYAENTATGGGASKVSMCMGYAIDSTRNDSLCINSSNAVTFGGAVTTTGALTVSSGGATVTAGGVTVNGGGVAVNSGAVTAGGAGTGLSVTNNASVTGTLTVTGSTAANGGLTIGSGGTVVSKRFRATTSWTPAAIASGGTSFTQTTVTVTGAVVGADCHVTPPAYATVPLSAYVSGADTVTITYSNPTASTITPPAGTYSVVVENP